MKNSSMKNWIKTIASGALLLTASSAMAGIIMVPVGGRYIAPESAPVNIQHLGGETFRIQTSGLTGQWIINGSDLPPEYNVPAAAQAVLPFTQDLELVIDISAGTVTGSSLKQVNVAASSHIDFLATGYASCVPRNGLDCGQLVVHLDLRGALTDPNDPANVGLVRMEMLGSMIIGNLFGGVSETGYWASKSANVIIAGNKALIGAGIGGLIGGQVGA